MRFAKPAQRGWLNIFNENAGHLRNRKWTSHPKGYYQWCTCYPRADVFIAGDASRRPATWLGRVQNPRLYTWEAIRDNLNADIDAPLDVDPLLPYQPQSWPRFLLGMTAHGWFLRPKVFPLMREGDKPSADPEKMMRRVWGFLAIGWCFW